MRKVKKETGTESETEEVRVRQRVTCREKPTESDLQGITVTETGSDLQRETYRDLE